MTGEGADARRAALDALVAEQHGVVARRQVLDLGLGRGWLAHRVRSGRWLRLHDGVFATHAAPLSFEARVQVALLALGDDAVASHRTAAFLLGLSEEAPQVVDVSVPVGHHVQAPKGVRVHRVRGLADRRHPARSPAITTVEETVLDLVDAAPGVDDVVSWLTRACQRRLTTAARLEAAAGRRARLRHRRLVSQVLADVQDGVASPLELRYVRDVERAHRLPTGERNGRSVVRGRTRYSDVRYSGYSTRVELEGLAYHPPDARDRDNDRDNDAALLGDATLRYGWAPIASRACVVAAEVAMILRRQGWPGRPRACSPTCQAGGPS